MSMRVVFSISVLILIGIVVVWPAQSPAWAQQPTKPPIEPTDRPPTKESIKPTSVQPTKTPLATKALPTKTAIPTIVLPTKLPLPTETPTRVAPSSLVLTITPGSAGVSENTSVGGTPVVHSESQLNGTSLATGQAPIVGVVFDDANGNDQHDPDEQGLPGVAVMVESDQGTRTIVTDAGGAYAVRPVSGATIRVIAPAGWRASNASRLPIERAGDFPLRATGLIASPRAITPLTLTQTVLDFAPLLMLGGAIGVVLALGFMRTSRAISTSNRQLALLMVRMQRASEKPQAFDDADTNRAESTRVLALLNQAGLDASGQPLQIERVLKVSANPAPAIVALGHGGQRTAFVVFTPLERKAFKARLESADAITDRAFADAAAYPLDRLREAIDEGQPYPLDALNSGLFVADDLAAAYAFLANDLPVAVRTLPRAARWQMWVAPLPRNTLNVQSGWRRTAARFLSRLDHGR